MGRSVVNLDAQMLEINEHAQAIADGAKRKEQLSATTKTLSVRNVAAETAHEEKAIAVSDAKSTRNLEVIDGAAEGDSPVSDEKTRRNRPKSKHPKSVPSPNTQPSSDDDPWVPSSLKMRNSKKQRLHWLSRTRELDKLAPFQKQDLIDEALDYIFDKYSADD